MFKAQHTQAPRVIKVDNNTAYPVVMEILTDDEALAAEIELRQVKYLNNVVEQDHRNIKRITKLMMGFKPINSAKRTLQGIEAMNMIRKGQVKGVGQGNSVFQGLCCMIAKRDRARLEPALIKPQLHSYLVCRVGSCG
ncbi:DDE-type integrase/transposase/recombinase [Leptolyngbya sp. ST-U4]|nr:DDE-type integrase/transposase/recombinase [Leptolyngbya sp. FACHB-711]